MLSIEISTSRIIVVLVLSRPLSKSQNRLEKTKSSAPAILEAASTDTLRDNLRLLILRSLAYWERRVDSGGGAISCDNQLR